MQPAAVGHQPDTVKPVETGKFILLRLQADCTDSEKEGLDPEKKQANIIRLYKTSSSLVRKGRIEEVSHINKKRQT